jgi:AcrR family transcriptional regulator
MPRPNRWADVTEAAAKIFRDKGYHAATLEDVADEVGMLKGSLYNYITTKEDLLFAVVRPPAERLLHETRALATSSDAAPNRILRLADNHVGVLQDYFVYASVYIHEVAGLGRFPEWAAMDHEYVALVRSILRAGVEEGTLAASTDLRTAPHILIGSLNWMTRWWNPTGPEPGTELAAHIAGTFLDGCRAPRPSLTTP